MSNLNKSLFITILISLPISVIAQDTAAYNIQREHINNMLAQRSERFSQYDESLNQRSGIFGLQTKDDIRRSNEILREVVLADNDIFKELKVLLDYKDIAYKNQANTVSEYGSRANSYKLAIKNLQEENQQLNKKLTTTEQSSLRLYGIIVFLSVLCALFIGTIAYSWRKRRKSLH